MSGTCKKKCLGPPHCKISLKNAENRELRLILGGNLWWVSSAPNSGQQKEVNMDKLLRYCRDNGNQDIQVMLNRESVVGNLRTNHFLRFDRIVFLFEDGYISPSSGGGFFLRPRFGEKTEHRQYLLVKICFEVRSARISSDLRDYENEKEGTQGAKGSAELALQQTEEAMRRVNKAEQQAENAGRRANKAGKQAEGAVKSANKAGQQSEAMRRANIAEQRAEEAVRRANIAEQRANEMASLLRDFMEELRLLRVQISDINTGLEGARHQMREEHFWRKSAPLYVILFLALLILVTHIVKLV